MIVNKRAVAIHEAGHVVAIRSKEYAPLRLCLKEDVEYVTMTPGERHGGACPYPVASVEQLLKLIPERVDLERVARLRAGVLMAGFQAELRLGHDEPTCRLGAQDDIETLKDFARELTLDYDMLEAGGNEWVSTRIKESWHLVERIADALMLSGSLTKEDIDRLLPD